jgi:hypothetical protein
LVGRSLFPIRKSMWSAERVVVVVAGMGGGSSDDDETARSRT